MSVLDPPSQHVSREQSAALLTLVLTAIVGGRRLLGEPGLLGRLLRQVPLLGAERTATMIRRHERPRVAGLPPALELELRRRARLHGMSFAHYLVAILGQLTRQASPVDGPRYASLTTPPRGQPPNLHLVLGGHARRQPRERDIGPIAEMPDEGQVPDET